MSTVGYSSQDAIITNFLYRNVKRTELERKILKLKEQKKNCDDYQMEENISKKIIRLKEELRSL